MRVIYLMFLLSELPWSMLAPGEEAQEEVAGEEEEEVAAALEWDVLEVEEVVVVVVAVIDVTMPGV